MMAVALSPVLTGSGPGTAPVADETGPPVLAGHRETPLSPTPAPQSVEPQTTLVAKADRHGKFRVDGPRGSRVWTASSLASHDLPEAALASYKRAAATMASTDPSCQMPWTLLAGVGRVESDHGRYGGSVLSTDGVSRPAIIGVALNGKGPVAAIRDTDNGRLDRDKVWDRAVGPMQFIPSTWAYAGRDGDGNGNRNPHDLDDAALAAAGYLCSGSGSMLVESSARAAVFRYNPSDSYVDLVLAFERGYRTGVFVMPSPEPPAGADEPRRRRHRDRTADTSTSTAPKPSTRPSSSGGSTASPKPSPKPTPKPSPTPDPDPTPTGPTLETVTGALSLCNGGAWCLGARQLDLGSDTRLAATAAHDYDLDGVVESNTEELTGLSAGEVTLRVGAGTSPAVVYVLAGHDYRFADGTFA
jgi:hypothetical protein